MDRGGNQLCRLGLRVQRQQQPKHQFRCLVSIDSTFHFQILF